MLTEAAITIVSAPAPVRNARSQTDHEVEHLPEEDLGGARRPSAIAEDDTLWPRYPSKRAEFLFFRPQQNGEWMTIQGQQNQRPRTRLESQGTHDHYDDARLRST